MNLFFEFHREALDPQIRENVRKRCGTARESD